MAALLAAWLEMGAEVSLGARSGGVVAGQDAACVSASGALAGVAGAGRCLGR